MSNYINNAIEVENLTKKFGSLKAIENLSFSVKSGEVLGFLGPNGAGKSTTMRILAGLMPATSGTARILGMPVSSHPKEIKAQLGYMPENNPLPEEMRVDEYLHYRSKLKNIPCKTRANRVNEVLEICDLTYKTKTKIIRNLSKGYRQRLGVADAILSKPKLIIMDEPTIGLDPHQIINFRQLISDLKDEITFMLSSHILSEIETSCTRVIIINHGRIVASGTFAELRHDFIPEQTVLLKFSGNIEALKSKISHISPNIETSVTTTPIETHYTLSFKTMNPHLLIDQLLPTISHNEFGKILEVSTQKQTLENVFLAATKRSWKKSLQGQKGKTAPLT